MMLSIRILFRLLRRSVRPIAIGSLIAVSPASGPAHGTLAPPGAPPTSHTTINTTGGDDLLVTQDDGLKNPDAAHTAADGLGTGVVLVEVYAVP